MLVSKIAELRKRANLTQKQLAELIGVTESTIRNLENNRNGIELLARVAKLCTALKCTAQDLVDFEEEEKI
ncbi:helix-turn-helix domain-containing protein [Scytonema sp. UIC 10036]|uniref:helix-turn-helix transcriptional regulator n=1 Tax=Scytonema sp. UIC 10036 TaxID=2304196 RepID=UPI0012DA6166|nr:helix-turn-helix transcriptional regulator [Scytonema sp. UIC 10036]MUG97728.1 helix-turn-helix domain-containing protein [Scytonema sp. UIC 10036]